MASIFIRKDASCLWRKPGIFSRHKDVKYMCIQRMASTLRKDVKFVRRMQYAGIAIFVTYIIREFSKGAWFYGEEMADGKTVIITGANTGIGKETAKELVHRGARVILACRDMEKCTNALADIVYETHSDKVLCRKLDLASFDSIRQFAKDINEKEERIDILINNAGVMRCPLMYTKENIEMQFGVNHLGHFLLTLLLLDKIKASVPSRIINVSSIAHNRGQINFEDLNSNNNYSPGDAYSQSKLANILFTRELAAKLEGTGVTVNAVHPGIVRTDLMRHMSIYNSVISRNLLRPFFWLLLKTPIDGAQTTLYCALDSDLKKTTGKYFSDCHEKDVAPKAMDKDSARRLWLISEKWTRLSESPAEPEPLVKNELSTKRTN